MHDPFVPTPGRARPEERRTGVELRSWGGYEKRRREREDEFCARVFCPDETMRSFAVPAPCTPLAGPKNREGSHASPASPFRTLGEPTVDPGAQISPILSYALSPRAARRRLPPSREHRRRRRGAWRRAAAAQGRGAAVSTSGLFGGGVRFPRHGDVIRISRRCHQNFTSIAVSLHSLQRRSHISPNILHVGQGQTDRLRDGLPER